MISKLKMISFMVLTFLALGLYSIVPAGALSEITVDNGLLVISADNYDTAEADIFSSLKNYEALAVSAGTLEQDLKLRDAVRNAFENSGIRVYLFGELTINDYKRLLQYNIFCQIQRN